MEVEKTFNGDIPADLVLAAIVFQEDGWWAV